MGLNDGRSEIDALYTSAAIKLSGEIYQDITFPSGVEVSHEDDRRELTPKAALILRHLAHRGLIDMDLLDQ